MNGNANLNANNLTPQNVVDWRNKLGINADLLWQNPNPTSQQGSQNITVPNLSKYKTLISVFKNWHTYGGEDMRLHKIKVPSEPYSTILADTGGTVSSRCFTITNATTINIAVGKKGTTTNNGQCVIVAFYGIKEF